ncbi:Tyrosine--tRNA ligase [Buchnera aphidicola (Thelaxes suberi)]|uniref:tyrosine--tRNA ligase n=1 Tax=Buchnera aphidicola TaxID=9 RepID=UPI003464B5B4
MNILTELYKKQMVYNISNKKYFENYIKNKSIVLYCGFDLTADSLHVGHLLPLLTLKMFQNFGHKPIVLIGGGTSLIGDPSFKEKKRILNSVENILDWEKKIILQVKKFLDFDNSNNSALIVNNYEWFKQANVLEFIRNIGKHFSINSMINKESVRKRIKSTDQGISFNEFSYTIFQAYDYLQLYKNYHTVLQIGGSDQWGNIVSGINLIQKTYNKQVLGLTIPLFIKSDGKKFGKTESGNVWLDANKTTPYQFYQFWINITDDVALNILNMFDLLKTNTVYDVKKTSKNEIIYLKQQLAKKITVLVHGKNEYIIAKKITYNLFSNNIHLLNKSDFNYFFNKDNNNANNSIPIFNLYYIKDLNLEKIVLKINFSTSLNLSRNLIISSGIKINGRIEVDPKYILTKKEFLFDTYTFLCKGKKNFALIKWVV